MADLTESRLSLGRDLLHTFAIYLTVSSDYVIGFYLVAYYFPNLNLSWGQLLFTFPDKRVPQL